MKEQFLLQDQPKTKLEALFQHANIGILIVNQEGYIEEANLNVEQLFGYDSNELIGQSVEVLLPEAFRHKHVQHEGYFEQPKTRPMGHGMDLRALKKNGDAFPVEISLTYYQVRHQMMTVAFIADMTERHQALAEIKNNEQKYLNIFESSLVGIITRNIDSQKLIDVNARAIQISGYESKEDFLENYNPLDHVFDKKDLEEIAQTLKEHGEVLDKEMQLKKLDGTFVWILFFTKLDFERNIRQTLLVDITERKILEEDFRNLYENNSVAMFTTEGGTFKVIAANDECVHLFGYDSKQDFIENYDALAHLVHPEERDKNRKIVTEGGGIKNKVFALKKRDGTPFWVHSSACKNLNNIIHTTLIDVTAKVLSRQERAASEEKYRNIFENAAVGILTWDIVEKKIISANTHCAQLFGYNNEKDFLENYKLEKHFVNLEDIERFVEIIEKHGELVDEVVALKTVEGRLFWGLLFSKMNDEKNILQIIFVDITERKALEEDFRNLYENDAVAMIVSDATTYKAINVNDKCARLLGYDSKQDFLENYNPLIHYVHSEDRDRNRAALKTYGTSTNKMMPVKKRDGTLLWVNSTLTVNPYKNIIQTLFIDITEEVQANEALRAREEFYRNIYHNSVVSMYTTDLPTFKTTDVNEMAVKLFGYTSKEDFLAHFDPRAHVVVKGVFEKNADTLEATGELNHKALALKKVDGTHFWANAFVKFNSDGRTAQAVIIDVTEQVRFQEDLEAKVKERTLELTESLAHEKEVNDMKTRLVSMAAHEFRTPLTTIMSSLFLLDVYTQRAQPLKKVKHMDRIRSSVFSSVASFLMTSKKAETTASTFPLVLKKCELFLFFVVNKASTNS